MLTVCGVEDYKNHRSRFNFIIVRSLIYPVVGLVHLNGLAPSQGLFEWALSNKSNPNWYEIYSNQFKKEMETPSFRYHLDMIEDFLIKGKKVTLVCYCKDVNLCHRKIVAEYFIDKGFKVDIF